MHAVGCADVGKEALLLDVLRGKQLPGVVFLLKDLGRVLLIGLRSKVREVLVGVCRFGRAIGVLLLCYLDRSMVIGLHLEVLARDLELEGHLEVPEAFDLGDRRVKRRDRLLVLFDEVYEVSRDLVNGGRAAAHEELVLSPRAAALDLGVA